ncbi:MAG: outer membrane lipoprotein-sorting protein [Verrucomicrobia bacterium]|nr:outer membrane lipoprotein-sorting protein [Verrucomicrobiota bacterium]
MKQAKKQLTILALFSFIFLGPVRAQEQAEAILDQVRSAQPRLDQPLSGQLRKDNGETIPLRMFFRGPELQIQFINPSETLNLERTESGVSLTDQNGSVRQSITGAKLTRQVRGTDISYEDLALSFLYWQNAKLVGEGVVRAITCSIIDVHPSSRDTEYGSVRLWIAKNRGALVKAEGFDWQGRLIKRFEIVSAQEIQGKTVFKQIRIERLNSQDGKVLSRTYLEVQP